jgi:outer membrane protein TolC
LRNASLAVQKAYASRWQTIASMLPQLDMSWAYQSMMGYEMNFGGMPIQMPDNGTLGVTASVGINGQAIVGALLNNVAIEMQKLNLEISEDNLRASVKSSYASVLVLEDVVKLLDSSLKNIEHLAAMTQRSVEVGAAEQTTADQILVRVNTLKNNINANKRSTQLAINALKVLLNVPAETELTLTTGLSDMLSAETIISLLGKDFVLENNLSYQTLAKNVELAQKNVHMAGWAYGPTVGVGYQYSKKDYFGKKEGFNMTPPNALSVQVSMPLWSSGKRAAGVVEKKIALEEARNTFEETTDNLGIQNEQLRYNLQNAFETYTNEQENIAVTQRVFDNTSLKFQQGVASNLDLVNASNDLITAQSSYVQAVLTLVNAEVELEKFLNL